MISKIGQTNIWGEAELQDKEMDGEQGGGEGRVDIQAGFNKWVATIVSAVSIIALFGADLNIGPLARGLVDNYKHLRDLIWSPFSILIHIDPAIKNVITFLGIFLFAFFLRGDKRNNLSAICMTGSMIGILIIAGVSSAAIYLRIPVAIEFFTERILIEINSYAIFSDQINNIDEIAVAFCIASVVIFAISAVLIYVCFEMHWTILVVIPIVPLILSVPGLLLSAGFAIFFGLILLTTMIIYGAFYWTIAFFFPQFGVLIHKIAIRFSGDGYRNYVLPAFLFIPYYIGISFLHVVRLKGYWRGSIYNVEYLDQISEEASRWLTIYELRSYYKPIFEVIVSAISIVIISKVVFDSFG